MKSTEPSQASHGFKWYRHPPIIILSFALLAMFAANNLYITAMPLYFSKELMLGASWVGILFGMAALCEIPIMLNAGRLAERFGTYRLIVAAAGVGGVFYLGMLSADQVWQFVVLQVFNGIFIGVIATLGMVAMQNMMSHQLGTASTLFTNVMQCSFLVASVSLGIVGEAYNYYSALYVSLAAMVLALILMVYFSLYAAKGADEIVLNESS